MIRTKTDITVTRTVQLKQYEPLVVSMHSEIALEDGDNFEGINLDEAARLHTLVDAHIDADPRERKNPPSTQPETYLGGSDEFSGEEPWNEPDYSGQSDALPPDSSLIPDIVTTDVPQGPPNAPQQGQRHGGGPSTKQVIYGEKSQFTGQPYWQLYCPFHQKHCGAKSHFDRETNVEMLQTGCKDGTRYVNTSITMEQAKAIRDE